MISNTISVEEEKILSLNKVNLIQNTEILLKSKFDVVAENSKENEEEKFNSDSSETSNNPNEKLEIIKNGKWSEDEDEQLKKLVRAHGLKNWKRIAEELPTRTAVQCLHRWTKILQPGLVKGPWTIEEDSQLIEWVKREGPHKWSHCSEIIRGRSGKQCRERWFNTLNPNVIKGNWSAQEDYLIFNLFSEYGSKWSKIASHFEGRTENSIKNRFYSTLRRIHAEKKKNDSETKNTSTSSNYNSTSREELLQYFSEALAEKTTAYINEKSKKSGDRMLNRKVNRQIFDVETIRNKESSSESNSLSPVFNNLDKMTIKDDKREFQLENFRNYPPNLLQSKNLSDFSLNANNNFPNNLNSNNSQFYSLLNQLNQIAGILSNTKGELVKFDAMKNNLLGITNHNYNNNYNLNMNMFNNPNLNEQELFNSNPLKFQEFFTMKK